MGPASDDDSRGRPTQVVMHKRGCVNGTTMVSAEHVGDTAGAVRVVLTPGSGAGRKCRPRDGGRDLLPCQAQQVHRGGCYLGFRWLYRCIVP